MNLSNRLLTLASLVDKDASIFDIGCDHGLLAIYLALNNHKVTATDISKDSVIKTKENAIKYNVDIEIYQKDGLDDLNIKKEDNIIIAGMGTSTILKILHNNINLLSDTLIIQTNKNHDILRREVCKLGYYIDKEEIIEEDYLYDIIRFRKGNKTYNEIDYILGISNNKIYLNKLLKRYNDLYNKIPSKYITRKEETNKIINEIQKRINGS